MLSSFQHLLELELPVVNSRAKRARMNMGRRLEKGVHMGNSGKGGADLRDLLELVGDAVRGWECEGEGRLDEGRVSQHGLG